MPKYFLAGQLPTRDLIGHECANEKEAKDHGSFIAHRPIAADLAFTDDKELRICANERCRMPEMPPS